MITNEEFQKELFNTTTIYSPGWIIISIHLKCQEDSVTNDSI